jgi:hypothetical protein
MNDETRTHLERMIEIARGRGLALDAKRAEALRPAVESLLSRLFRLSRQLPTEAAPAPGPVDPER